MTALWANVHASFFFAPLIALLFALEDRWYLKAAVVAALAPLLNPYGPHLYVHVFRYLTDTDLLSRIGEFQSFDFHSAGAAQIIVTVILGVVGGTLALTQKRCAPLCARHADYGDGAALRPRPAALRAAPAADRQRRDHAR